MKATKYRKYKAESCNKLNSLLPLKFISISNHKHEKTNELLKSESFCEFQPFRSKLWLIKFRYLRLSCNLFLFNSFFRRHIAQKYSAFTIFVKWGRTEIKIELVQHSCYMKIYGLWHGRNEFYALLYKFSSYFPRQALYKSLPRWKAKEKYRQGCVFFSYYYQKIFSNYKFGI